jgi:hypothetical protein
MLGALTQQALNVLFLGCTSLVAIGLGRLVLCRMGIRFVSSWEWAVFCAALGFGILSYAVFLLCALQVLYHEAVYILFGLCTALGLAGWLRGRSGSDKTTFSATEVSLWDKGVLAVLATCLFFACLLVLTPAIGKDALIYHLAVPKLFQKHHGFYFIEGNIFANYPLSSEMLYAMALALRGDVLAKGIHFVIGLCILLGMWQFARQHVSESRFVPLALLIFCSIPSVFVTSHMAYNDLTVTLYAFLSVYAFLNWFSRKENAWLILCGVFSGLAMSTKYTGIFLPFLGCLGTLWASRHHGRATQQALRSLLVYLACALVVGSPFYVKNWIMTGNPFYPFLYGIFGGRGWDSDQAQLYELFVQSLGMGRGLLDYLLLPWNVSVNARMASPQFDGILGPVFILTLPFALGMRKISFGAKISMAYGLFTFMFWASSAQQIRYLIPVFPFLAIMTVYILSYYRRKKVVFSLLMVFVTGSLGFNGYHIARDFLRIGPAGVITGHEETDAFLKRMVPSYKMFQYVNTNLPEESKLFLIYMKNFGYLCDRPYYSDSMFESYTIQKILTRSETATDVYDSLRERGFTHILYDINHVFGNMSTFSAQEKSLFFTFQKDHLELIKADQERYYLYRL